jgi:hypothetical protein
MPEPLTLMQRSLVGVIVLLGCLCALRYSELYIPAKAEPVHFIERSPVSYPSAVKPHHSRDHTASTYTNVF